MRYRLELTYPPLAAALAFGEGAGEPVKPQGLTGKDAYNGDALVEMELSRL